MKPTRMILSGMAAVLLAACGTTLPATPTIATTPTQLVPPQPTLTPDEQTVIAEVATFYGPNFHPSRADCVQAVEAGAATGCVFPTGIVPLTMPEWNELFPKTPFYIVDISGWRSGEHLLPHETQDAGTSRQIAAVQNGQVYRVEEFDRLLEANSIAITDMNRELVARSFALMSIPDFLHGEVRFLSFEPVPPGNYRYAYTHLLEAWTEIWGCNVAWSFVFADTDIETVSRQGGECWLDSYGEYIEDGQYFEFGDEAIPLGVPPYFRDFYFTQP